MAILLIRHGETQHNAARVIQPPGAALSERGIEQARRLAERLAQRSIGHILASDLERARHTADTLRERVGAPLELAPELQERNFGDLRGTPYAELEQDIFAPGYAPPAGETWEVFDRRVDAAWARVRRALGEVSGDLAVVTHGLVCQSLARQHLRLDGVEVPARWANTSLTVIEAEPPWSVEILNCSEHLDDGTRSEPIGPAGPAGPARV